MFNLRHTLGVAALLLTSTSAIAAPLYCPSGSCSELGGSTSLYAHDDTIKGWFVNADAAYASEIFFYIEDANGDIIWEGNTFFKRQGGSSTTIDAEIQTIYELGMTDKNNVALTDSIVGNKVGFGLTVYTGGTYGAGPSHTFYTDHARHVGATSAGPRAFVISWDPDADGPLAGAEGISVLLYLGFEDQIDSSDFDYNDHQFVFSGIGTDNPVPEPSTWAMMITGVAGLAMGVWRRRRSVVAVSADKQ